MKKDKRKSIALYEDDFLIPSIEEENPENSGAEKTGGRTGMVIACIIIGLIAGITAAILCVDNGFIGEYKKNFSTNIRAIDDALGLSDLFHSSKIEKVDVKISDADVKINIGSTFEQNSYMLPFENASLSQYALGNKGIAVAKSNYAGVFDADGKLVWETQTSVIEPILRTEGEYTLLAEKGGTRLCLYQNEAMIFSVDDPNAIISAQLSSNGDVVLVTKKEFYKNAVSVYNKNGEQIFSWSSGTDTIVNADISRSTRRIAVALVNTDERVKSYVMLFDINQTQPYHNVEFTESVIFGVKFIGETLNLTGDNRLSGLAVKGDIEWDNLFPDSELALASCDSDGNKAVAVDRNNIPEIIMYGKNGDERDRFGIDVLPDFVDVRGKNILFNVGRIVEFGRAGRLHQYIASMDIKGLKAIDDDSFVIIYNNSLEFVKAG